MTKDAGDLPKSYTNTDQAAVRRSIRDQWLMFALALVVLAGVFTYQSLTSHRTITDQEHQRLQTQTRVIASNIEHQLEATNRALTSLIKDMPYLRRHENLQLANRRLQTLAEAMPGIRTMFVIDAEGTVVASNRDELIGRNIHSRDYFATPAHDNNPSTLYLSPPFKTVLGSFLVDISRTIPAANGSFNGVVTAALDPEYFQVLLSSVLYAPDMWSAINHGDGIRFMMVPDEDGQSGKNLALPGTFFTRHRESGRIESVLTGRSVSYGSKRVMALRTVQPHKLRLDKPLYVTCSRDYAAIYQSWRSSTLKQAGAFVLIGVASGFGMVLLQRRQREMASLAAQAQDLMNLRAEERHKLGIRYQTLQAVARDGIHILDQDGTLIESNAAFRRMLGYAAEDNLELNVTDWDAGIPPENLAVKVREMIHAPVVFETRHRRRDGTIFDAEVNGCGVQLDGTWYLYASSRDISKRKEMEASLRESRQFLADIFNFLPDATFVVDLDKKVIAWNRAMEEMSGVAKEEMLGQGDHAYTIPFYGDRRNQLLDLIDVDDDELMANYQGVTRRGDRLFGEAFCPALYNGKGAHIWGVVAPLYDSDGKRIGAIESIRDITAIKATEANLARSNQELEQFAYIASHDLQEPLRKIAGFTELLAIRSKVTLDEKAESYMAYIVDGATRMSNLINDLLSYSRIMSSTRELAETDCSAVLSKVLRDLELVITESNTEVVCGPLPIVHADKTQLGQLFQNLIGNAIKYRAAASPVITISAVKRRTDWLFSVADNGIGIAPEFNERIFAIFQRLHTRAEYPGTGIGLAICQRIVKRHGGRIWVESTIPTGSTFFFTIPLTPKHPEAP
ncbi:MAG: PAS domain S-box protein [Proteobacteria bacterium]|nr:PAS domain S-box protein [Pseudomonadota bacterium]